MIKKILLNELIKTKYFTVCSNIIDLSLYYLRIKLKFIYFFKESLIIKFNHFNYLFIK